MSTWIDHPTFASQFESDDDFKGAVPRPDEFPEDPSDSQSYWIREHPIDVDRLVTTKAMPLDVDVVVIGSGISGAAAVYHISKTRPDLSVCLLEARGICTGATGRNGGFLARPECYHLVKTAKTWGAEEAIRLKKAPMICRDMVLECIEELGIADAVDLRLKGSLLVFENAEEQAAFKADYEFAQSHGWEPEGRYVKASDAAKRFGLNPFLTKYGAAFLERGGTVYPRKLVEILLQTSLDRMPRLTIHQNTPAEAIVKPSESMPSYQVLTPKGNIKARAVFHATNAYAGNLCPELKGSERVFGAKAHMLSLRPNVSSCSQQLETGFGYADYWHYLHQRPSQGPFLYGLADAEILNDYNDTITLPVDHPIRKKMANFLEETFPAWFQNMDLDKDVTHDWTGIQGLTMSGASIVGRLSKESPGEFVNVGHNGEGMGRCFSNSVVATDVMLAYLEGKDCQVPEWFPHCFRRHI